MDKGLATSLRREIDGVPCVVTCTDGISPEDALKMVDLHVTGNGPLKTVRATRGRCEVVTTLDPLATCEIFQLDVLAGVFLGPGKVIAISLSFSSGRSPIGIGTCKEPSQPVI